MQILRFYSVGYIDRLLFLQESAKVKESSLHEIWNADTAFLVGQIDSPNESSVVIEYLDSFHFTYLHYSLTHG